MEAEERLTGKTLLVYLYVLKKTRVMAREVKEALSFSNTSLAIYYLDKLYRMGLVDKEGGYYILKKKVDLTINSVYTSIYGILLPKFLPYAVFFTVLLIFYLIFKFDSPDLFAFFSLTIVSAIFWYESIRAYLRLRLLYRSKA